MVRGGNVDKIKIVKSKILADALVWLGFEYQKDNEDNYVFIRSWQFDKAWEDLHYLKSVYGKRMKK